MMIGDHNYSMSSVDENDISNVSLDTTTIENSDSGSNGVNDDVDKRPIIC